jgi:hypothetical protein
VRKNCHDARNSTRLARQVIPGPLILEFADCSPMMVARLGGSGTSGRSSASDFCRSITKEKLSENGGCSRFCSGQSTQKPQRPTRDGWSAVSFDTVSTGGYIRDVESARYGQVGEILHLLFRQHSDRFQIRNEVRTSMPTTSSQRLPQRPDLFPVREAVVEAK